MKRHDHCDALDSFSGSGAHRRVAVPLLALALLVARPGPVAAQSEILVPLDAEGFDMVLDAARERIYVSIPTRNEVVFISTVSGRVENRLRLEPQSEASGTERLVGTRPHGMDLSLDGSTLLVALNEASSVAILDLDSDDLTQVVIGAELDNAKTWDVIEGKPNRVFASANPSSGGFAYIAQIKTDESNSASRVASNRIIRSRPTFARDPAGAFLYVGEGFSPNSLYKLDLSTDAAPIVLEDDHGSVSGTDRLEVSPDGSRIYLGSGQVLRTSDFIQIGLVGSGIPRVNADGSLVYVADASGAVEVYETTFFSQVDAIALPCAYSTLRSFELLDDGNGFVMLGDDNVCGLASATFQRPRCELRPSYAAGTLSLEFELASPQPVRWNAWLSAGSAMVRLWSIPLPAIDPPVSFSRTFQGFPQLGRIGFLSTLVGTGGITCSDFEVVDTGAAATAADPRSLRDLPLASPAPVAR